MSNFDYDYFVIGGGSGGVRSSRWASGLGARVGICEEDKYGGTCVIRGCVPKKLMVYAAHLPSEVEAMKNYGWSVEGLTHDWKILKENRDNEINRLTGIYENILGNNNVDHFKGKGTIIDKNTVQVGDKKITSKYILIATGGRPYIPEIPGSEFILNSNHLFTLEERPKDVAIIGAGYIAVEFAGILHGLGSSVELVVRKEQILSYFDCDVASFLQNEMIKKGIKFKLNSTITSVKKDGDHFKVTFSDGSTAIKDAVFSAAGRIPNTQGLGLENVGIKTKDNGKIIVNDKFQTNVENIYAVGDVCNDHNLTPVALKEGMIIAENLFKGTNQTMDYTNIPTAVFSDPNIGTVGLTEEEAKEKFGDIKVYKSEFRALKHTVSGLEERTLMKLITTGPNEKVVGLHMVGADSGEITQGFAVAIKMGATKADFDQTIGIHPTSAEEFVTMRS